jgi:putative intracellular protease/amidase
MPDGALEAFESRAGDVLVICGGPHWQSPGPIDIGRAGRDCLTAGGTLAAICGGTLALAKAGLLEGQEHKQ